MKKVFDVIAALCGILILVFGMCLDSPSNTPINICLACGGYLLIYIYLILPLAERTKSGD